jgi:hypothetical protein
MPVLYDLKLDPVTHDLVIEGGDAVLITGLEETAQAIRVALLTFAAEWYLDRSIGWMDFKGMPFGKSNMNAVRARVLREIAAVENVLADPPPEVVSISQNPATRVLSISFRAQHSDGPIVGSVTVPPP